MGESAMMRSVLIALVAGQRAMTPLALLAGAARRGTLEESAFARWLSRPAIAAGAVALAAAEMAGDKLPSAPDRIIAPGLAGRATTAAVAGWALASPGERRTAAILSATTAVAASYAGFALRTRAMQRFGQSATGFIEDALVLTTGLAVVLSREPAR
jgi:uncharacterized membrane protein